MPAISVIVPVYNTEKILSRCIDSILAQSFSDFELLLVDDGSSDNSGKICDEYENKDGRIHVFHQSNKGQAAARNYALDWILANSESQYISFVDSDDWVHPMYLELLLQGIYKHKVNICQCMYMETNGKRDFHIPKRNIQCISSVDQYTHYYSAFLWDKLFSRNCWNNIRFPEGQIYEDLAVWYKILFNERNISIINDVLYYYYINPDSTVHQQWTPKRLSQVVAWENQISYFTKMKNNLLVQCAATHQMQILLNHFRLIEQSSKITYEEKKTYKKQIQKKIQKAYLRFYNNEFIDLNRKYIRAIAFPKMYYLYWTLKGIEGKIKSILTKG